MWRLGSYITQGVYTVSGPFHPFGGAVDIVVVQQQDGSFKSSPWYVKFGKFQGVLKAKERVVDINVNGVDADFHMYLDPRGEAYFLREVDSDSSSSSCEEVDGKGSGKMPIKSKSLDCEFDQLSPVTDVSNGQVLTRNNSKRSRIMAFVRGRRSMKENTLSKDENDLNADRMGSLERAEMAADLLEMRWSTNLSSRSNKNDDREASKDNGDVIGGRLETGLVLHEQHFVNKSDSSGVDSEVPVMEVKETIVADAVSKAVDEESSKTQLDDFIEANNFNKTVDEESSKPQFGNSNKADAVNKLVNEESSKIELDDSNEADVVDKTVDEESLKTQLDDTNEPEVGLITAQGSLEIVPESYAEVGSNQGDASVEGVSCSSVSVPFIQTVEESLTKEVDEKNEIRTTLESNGEFQDVPGDAVLIKEVSERVVEEQLIFNDSKPGIKDIAQKVESTTVIYSPDPPPVRTHQERPKDDPEGLNVNTFRRCPTYVDIRTNREITEKNVLRHSKSLPNMRSHVDDIAPDSLEEPQFYSPVGRSSNWDLIREDALRFKRENLEKQLSRSGDNVSKDLKDGSIPSGGPADIVDGAGGSWSLWPFRRSVSKSVSDKKESDVDTVPEIDGEKEDSSPKLDKNHTRALTPTSEQLASLNLAQGQNTVTFTFSTSVLGAQKVDARIYLWSWDTRIVISDVDGTITKSDVLGQFMPLVGRDWSHIGVTHLFSGIKENGYQMLYLSARAISQASLTRQFLFNLTQDGKALPDGPVVISPDGLFPSLFREVIRRAPHEFKIACLEDIKACFPSDRNPFYAGFGNRDTDEFSYLKVGIPKGKIFIINPKGEVVINRSIDSKSYASLHALVNGIFPPVSGHEEQEDYNSWNFWKLPPPTMD